MNDRKVETRGRRSASPFLLSVRLSSDFISSLLVTCLIFIAAEFFKQFSWSGCDMKIDNCDPPLLPGKQKRMGELFPTVCVRV